jgi:hypothetical protein
MNAKELMALLRRNAPLRIKAPPRTRLPTARELRVLAGYGHELTDEQHAIAYGGWRNMRMPKWANPSAIKAVYAECKRLTQETGIPHHVDHIIPLRGEYVSGLHVETNLQVLPRIENLRKRNKCT